MKANAVSVIFAGPGGWRVADGDAPPRAVAPAAAAPAEVVDALLAALGRRRHVAIALDAAWCLAARIPTGGLPRKDRRTAMVYRLEEGLPTAAEALAVDFVERDADAFGVAARVEPLAAVLDGLDARGVSVASLCPTALLAVATLPTRDVDLVVWRHARGTDVVALVNGAPTGWHALRSADDGDARRHAEALARGGAGRTLACGLDAAGVAALTGGTLSRAASHGDANVERAAAALLTAGGRPPVDLRRDALAPRGAARQLRGPARAAAVALFAFAVAAGGAGLWVAHRSDVAARAARADEAAIFRELFPRSPLPASVASRLASEARRLAATGNAPEAAAPRDATYRLIHDVLARLPAAVRLRVGELRFDVAAAVVTGEARSRGDVDAVAAALRGGPAADGAKSAGAALEVDVSRVEQREGQAVTFTLDARRPAAARAADRTVR